MVHLKNLSTVSLATIYNDLIMKVITLVKMNMPSEGKKEKEYALLIVVYFY
jgi:hypothetical protein